MKRIQNRIAESGLLLPSMALIALGLQFLVNIPSTTGEWISLMCFTISAYLMVELSNGNALLRVRSRMVTSTFITLSMAGGLLIGSIPAMLTQLFWISSLLLLFTTYQDKRTMGRIYYAFILLSIATFSFVQSFLLIPFVWVLMATQLQSLSWRNWGASLLGLLTPYWLLLPVFIWQQDFTLLTDHFHRLVTIPSLFNYASVTIGHASIFVLTVLLSIIGVIHFLARSYEDKIRIRLLYGFLTTMMLLCAAFIILLPLYYDTLIRLLLVFASPLIAHFLALTSSRVTNVLFILSIIIIFAITIFNILNI